MVRSPSVVRWPICTLEVATRLRKSNRASKPIGLRAASRQRTTGQTHGARLALFSEPPSAYVPKAEAMACLRAARVDWAYMHNASSMSREIIGHCTPLAVHP